MRVLRCRCCEPRGGGSRWGIPAWGTADVTMDLPRMDRVVPFRYLGYPVDRLTTLLDSRYI